MKTNPELGKQLETCGYITNYHDIGAGQPLLLLHGSGPGVSAWANWRTVVPVLSQRFRVVMPDLVGFGYTLESDDFNYRFLHSWIEQIESLLNQLQIERTTVVGNSFGGAVALALAVHRPDLVDRLVLMGAVGVPEKITEALDNTVWGYQPSPEAMKKLMESMTYNRELVTEELAELRYQASLRPRVQTRFEKLFPAPRQQWLDACSQDYTALTAIRQKTLILHGRDDEVIPLSMSLKLHQLIECSQLHVFGQCGHWTQIEQSEAFIQLVSQFALDKI